MGLHKDRLTSHLHLDRDIDSLTTIRQQTLFCCQLTRYRISNPYDDARRLPARCRPAEASAHRNVAETRGRGCAEADRRSTGQPAAHRAGTHLAGGARRPLLELPYAGPMLGPDFLFTSVQSDSLTPVSSQ